MSKTKLTLWMGFILFLILPSVFAKNHNLASKSSIPRMTVLGEAPVYHQTTEQPAKQSEEYYGIDFNCDGFGDQVFGVPNATVSGFINAGSVSITYGGAKGITTKGNESWTLAGIGLMPEPNDGFGFSLGAADIDDDGCAELLAGAPGRAFGNDLNVGAVYVFWGSPQGLQSTGFTELRGESAGDLYGFSVIWGDFNGDDFYDVAGGAVGHKVGSKNDAGAVYVDYGPELKFDLRQRWTLNSPKIKGTANKDDLWGFSLYSGKFNGDIYYDLGIGAPFGKVGTKNDAGFGNLIFGSPEGLRAQGNQFLFLTNTKVGDQTGFALNSCYCNADNFEDFLISSIGYQNRTGLTILLYGSQKGITETGSQALLDPEGEEGDEFGRSIVSLGMDARFGIYIGAPGADIKVGSSTLDNAGKVALYGNARFPDRYEYKGRVDGVGLGLARNAGDNFGFSQSVTTNQNRYTTIFFGIPGANIGGKNNAGAALGFNVSLNDYTKLSKPVIWSKKKLAGEPAVEERFALTLGYQYRF